MENEQKNQSKYMNVSIYILFVVLGIVFFGGQAIMEQVILDIGQSALWIYLIAIIVYRLPLRRVYVPLRVQALRYILYIPALLCRSLQLRVYVPLRY